ncbi:head scaffolding protein [Acinetobacter phage IMEAB3]|uniref:Putative scaffold protein n=2 Tax=Lokivirus IMEAB3 TaxID=2560266 RepID=A0A481S2K0_9CAUD|nr:head scaffolding protein [Acinetobacter phage IMEAB3]AHI60037.1 putative scaffold protein [Acinetobacter phage IMEAB3]QBG78696.1 putative scaffold protein [Acinetobacter phage vB_AbaS_D0]
MALKRVITKEEFDKLPADIKTEYLVEGDGYKLDISGDEDTGALKRAKDREKQLRQDAEDKLKEAQAELDRINGDDARKKGDIATLEKSWQKKLDDQKAELEGKLTKRELALKKSLVEDEALKIATKISTAPALIMPHIKARLVADLDADTPTTKVLGADGKDSTMSLDDLTKEFIANKDFSAIIIAGKGSGGSTNKDQNRGGAPKTNTQGNDETPNLSRMNPKDLAARIAEKKANSEDD